MSPRTPAIAIDQFATFGDLLRHLRRRAGLTQRELSIAVGYSDAMISRLEQNQRLPDLATLAARFVPALGLEEEPETARCLLGLAAAVRREDAPAAGLPPFKGLLHFEETDAEWFFGRERLTAKLATRLRASAAEPGAPRFLAIVGASGSGKSSLIRAGLIPALRWSPESAAWPVHLLTPTAHPLEALADSLLGDSKSAVTRATLASEFAGDTGGLYRAIRQVAQRASVTHGVIVVDQFEELFTLCRAEPERRGFVDNLLTAAFAAGGPATVVLALRADFYAHCSDFPNLREALAQHQEYIGGMTAEELRRAIEEPAARGRWDLEPGLVDLLLRDVGAERSHPPEPGALPLLSHALLETWQRRRGHTLTLSGYAASGGVRGAIAETADALFHDQLTPAQRAIARHIFLQLTELGQDDAVPDTRRRVALGDLVAQPERAVLVRDVLTLLADARLITTDKDTAEVAHEALIREWPTLREWLAEDREVLRLQRRLADAAQEWARMNRDEGLAYRGARLAQALEWAVAHPAELSALEREFLDASRALAGREAAEREAQRQREMAALQQLVEAEKYRAEERASAARRLRLRAIYLSSALLVAISAALLAVAFGQQAQAQKRFATSRELASLAMGNLAIDPERSLLLALHALSIAHTAEAENALHSAVQTVRVQFAWPGLAWSTTYNPDGTRLAISGEEGVKVIDTGTGQAVLSFGAPGGNFWDITYSPDGKRLAANSADQTTRVWDAATGQELLTLAGHTGSLDSVAFSPDGTRIATSSYDNTARVWNAMTGEVVLVIVDHTDIVPSIAFSPDGSRLITGSWDKTVKVRDAETGEVLLTPQGEAEVVGIYSPDGRSFVTFGANGATLVSWDAASAQPLVTFDPDNVARFAFSADGRRLVTGTKNGTVTVWDTATGDELLTIHTPEVIEDVDFSPDGQHVATVSAGGTVRVFDISVAGSREWLTVAGHDDMIRRVAYSPDGTRLATAGWEGLGKVFDAATGNELLTLDGHRGPVYGLAYSPNGARLATAGQDKTIRIWDATSGQPLLTLSKPDHGEGNVGGVYRGILEVVFSPDGERLASAGSDGTTIVWEAGTGQELASLPGTAGGVINAAFSPDGKYLVTTSDSTRESYPTTTMWDLGTGRMVFDLPDQPGLNFGLAFDPDGTQFATGAMDGVLRLWDATTGVDQRTLPGHSGLIMYIRYSPDGRSIATTSTDGTVKVWDAETGLERLTLTGHTGAVAALDFSPDATRLASVGDDGTVRVYALRLEDLIELARSRVTRSLTVEECRRFLHVETCP